MNKGAAITAALISSPIGPLVGTFAMMAVRFANDYKDRLAMNARSRKNGFPVVDPSQYEFFMSIVPTTLTFAAAGTIFAVVAHLIIGVPTVMFSANSFRDSVIMQLIAPMLIGALSGVIFFSNLIGPVPSVVAGSAGALAMAICARRFSRDTEPNA